MLPGGDTILTEVMLEKVDDSHGFYFSLARYGDVSFRPTLVSFRTSPRYFSILLLSTSICKAHTTNGLISETLYALFGQIQFRTLD